MSLLSNSLEKSKIRCICTTIQLKDLISHFHNCQKEYFSTHPTSLLHCIWNYAQLPSSGNSSSWLLVALALGSLPVFRTSVSISFTSFLLCPLFVGLPRILTSVFFSYPLYALCVGVPHTFQCTSDCKSVFSATTPGIISSQLQVSFPPF